MQINKYSLGPATMKFESIQKAVVGVPELAAFLRLVQLTRLYRTWIPRKPVTMLAPISDRLVDLDLLSWPVRRVESFILRHTLPGRLHWQRLCAKSRLITLSGDLLPLGSRNDHAALLRLVRPDIMVEGILIHLVDVLLPPSSLHGMDALRASAPHGRTGRDEAPQRHDSRVATFDLSDKRLSLNHSSPRWILQRRGRS